MTQDATIGIQEYLRRLTPQTRGRLLAELERMRLCRDDIPGTDVILTELRKEFSREGQPNDRLDAPGRYFFQPLEPFLLNRPPEQARASRISRASLTAIWDLVSRDLMQSLAGGYGDEIKRLVAANNQHGATHAARLFQNKAIKYLEGMLASAQGGERARAALGMYTSLRATFDDLTKTLRVLKARDALAQFDKDLPATIIKNFDDEPLQKVHEKLDAFAERQKDALPFALVLAMRRLQAPWQLIRLATKDAEGKEAEKIAATRYASAVDMVLDRLEERTAALRDDLRTKRAPLAKDILREIYDTEYALQVRINGLAESAWGQRLDAIMTAVSDLLKVEMEHLPAGLRHVYGSRSLKRHDSLLGQMTWMAWKCRDALSDGAAFCRNLVGSGRASS